MFGFTCFFIVVIAAVAEENELFERYGCYLQEYLGGNNPVERGKGHTVITISHEEGRYGSAEPSQVIPNAGFVILLFRFAFFGFDGLGHLPAVRCIQIA